MRSAHGQWYAVAELNPARERDPEAIASYAAFIQAFHQFTVESPASRKMLNKGTIH
jgi:hypothetical protein